MKGMVEKHLVMKDVSQTQRRGRIGSAQGPTTFLDVVFNRGLG